MTYLTDYTPEPQPLDALIAAQAMDRRVTARHESLARDVALARLILQQRCRVCRSWLDEEARCSHCGHHQ